MADQKIKDRARDELFSHINRCGVLEATEEDKRHWMDETIEYIGERYPELSDGNLQELYAVGLNFCKPAVSYARGAAATVDAAPQETEDEAGVETAGVGQEGSASE